MPKPLRTFIATGVDKQMQEYLRQLEGELKQHLRGEELRIKWIDPAQIHLTLRFLGNLIPEKIALVSRMLRENLVGVPAFSVRPCGLGIFGSRQHPRGVWLDLKDRSGRLLKLHSLINDAIGNDSEEDFRAHLTLGRIKRSHTGEKLCREIEKVELGNPPELWVERVDLLESKLTQRGADYTILSTTPLSG